MTDLVRQISLDGPVANRPHPREADGLMELVSEQLGARWDVVYLGGTWLFRRDGQPVLQSRRRFLAGLAEATGCAVVVSTPLA